MSPRDALDHGGPHFRPVGGAKLQVLDADLLDECRARDEQPPGVRLEGIARVPSVAPSPARDGRFRIEGLADRACFWIRVNRPETDNASLAFYAATIDGRDTIHQQLPPGAFNGRSSA